MSHSILRAKWFLFFLSFTYVAQAVYYIDDADGVIQYSTGSGSSWIRMSESAGGCSCIPDKTGRIFYNTLTHNDRAGCPGGSGCTVTIPFKGSGITLYCDIRDKVLINIVVDGGSPSTYHFLNDDSYKCFSFTGILGCPNTSIFDVQHLAYGNHNVQMTLPSSAEDDLFFDYAAVNDTIYPPPTNTSASASPTGSTSQTATSSHNSTGPAVGGAIGGSAFIAVVSFAILYYRRRRKRNNRELGLVDEETKVAQPGHPREISELASSAQSPTFVIPTTSPNTERTPTPRSTGYGSSGADASAPVRSAPSSPSLDQRLSREQVELIQNMHTLNVPPPAIAALLDGMLRGEGSSSTRPLPDIPPTPPESSTLTGSRTGAHPESPPDYDFK